jgi:ketosteroid isomerase-like protein
MSEENVGLVRRYSELFIRQDFEQMLDYMDPEFELHSAIVGGAEGNVYRGHEGFRRWRAEFFESFEEFTGEVNEVRDLGDRVLTFGRIRARGRESGVELDSPIGWVFTVRDGKLVRAEGFLSRDEALEAAGVRE